MIWKGSKFKKASALPCKLNRPINHSKKLQILENNNWMYTLYDKEKVKNELLGSNLVKVFGS